MIAPMTPATIRRLMRTADEPGALDAERLREAEARGRLAGLLLVKLMEVRKNR